MAAVVRVMRDGRARGGADDKAFVEAGFVDDGLPEGAVIAVGGERYKITYAGGDGNDVVLDRLGAIGDRVWFDLFCDGWRDAGERGLCGVAVGLSAAADSPTVAV